MLKSTKMAKNRSYYFLAKIEWVFAQRVQTVHTRRDRSSESLCFSIMHVSPLLSAFQSINLHSCFTVSTCYAFPILFPSIWTLVIAIMVRVTLDDHVLAESNDTIVVEGNHYFPPTSVRTSMLSPSETTSVCPWKGWVHFDRPTQSPELPLAYFHIFRTASYYDAVLSGKTTVNDVAWSVQTYNSRAPFLNFGIHKVLSRHDFEEG
jgi:uncharacterized protein (DUF427 family)